MPTANLGGTPAMCNPIHAASRQGRSEGRKGNLYRVAVMDKLPNLGAFAEPMPNLGEPLGSAP